MYPYFEAPDRGFSDTGPSVFLAGGMTSDPDWRQEASARLLQYGTVFNPCQRAYVSGQSSKADRIKWEFDHLILADVILFWFPDTGSVQPMSLFELGAFAYGSLGHKKIAVGVDPHYSKGEDIHHQLRYARPDLLVYHDLDRTIGEAIGLLTGP